MTPKDVRCILLVSILLLVCAGIVSAQTAQITGRVVDSTDALVPDADITVTALDTGTQRKTVTNSAGHYTVPVLEPGNYRTTVRKEGFNSVSRSNIALEVYEVARIDFVLQLGSTTETINVTAEIPRVQTEDAALGTVVENKRVEDLPLNGRHILSLVQLVPGVRPRSMDNTGFADNGNKGISQISINGGSFNGNEILLDGANNTKTNHKEISIVPMLDSVAEFKVLTNGLKAEHGQTTGGVISVVTKAGTNELHGSLYEFLRNDALDARNAFTNTKSILRYNQFGGTVGGPVFISGLYNGKNQTFFFFGYEQWRHRVPKVLRGTVPTAIERNGDFSNTRDAKGSLLPVSDPATTRANPEGSGFIRDPLPGNIVPQSRLDPLSLRVLEYMPTANTEPINAFNNSNNLLTMAPGKSDQGNTTIRLDHQLSEKTNLLFRFSSSRNTVHGEGYGLGPADPQVMTRRDQRNNFNWIFKVTHTLSPTVVNEFRAGVTRPYLTFEHPSYGGNWPEQLGFPKIIPPHLFPNVVIDGMLQLGATQTAAGYRHETNTHLTDNLTVVRGRHQFKSGFDLRVTPVNYLVFNNASGKCLFPASLTNNPQKPAGTGVGLATYLLGEVGGGELVTRPALAFHAWSVSGYVQDDFKVTPRMTLNVGLRYDLDSVPWERWNRHSNFDPFLKNPETGMPGLMTYAGVSAPRRFVERDWNNFGPRFGFAYDPAGDGKMVIRGAYGLLYVPLNTPTLQSDNSNDLGFTAVTPFSSPAGPFRAFLFSEGPTEVVQAAGASGGPSAFRGRNVEYDDRNTPGGYSQQWNFTVQRQLHGSWVISLAYGGNRGVRLFGGDYDLNQLDPMHYSLGLALQDRVENPFYGEIATGSLSGPTVAQSQLLRPLPDYGGVTTHANRGVSSTYHSMQVTLEKRYSQGLSMLVSYTTSKLINDAFSIGNGNMPDGQFRIGRLNRRLDRAIDEYDVSQRLVLSAVYELPFGGSGKPWLGSARGVVKHLVGGWQINTFTTLETGSPLSIRGANNFTGINWPDVTYDPTLPRSERSADRWFDTDAFRNPPDFVMGNVPRTLPNTRAPGLFDISFSVFKTFSIREHTNLEFRADGFNVLNHVNHNSPATNFSPNAEGVNVSAAFGRITGSRAARIVQLGLRLTF